jgi:arylsulfatase A-like enzyme
MLCVGTAAGAGLVTTGACLRTQTEPDRGWSKRAGATPVNLLFINTDQQRFDALGCAGNPCVSTPNLDRLARDGVRFSYAFTPQPMCVAARGAFHSGLTLHTSRCWAAFQNRDEWDFGTGSWDQSLDRHGYHCEYHGRWHTGTDMLSCYRNQVSLDFLSPYREWLREEAAPEPPAGENQVLDAFSRRPYTPDPIDYQFRRAHGDPPSPSENGIHYGVSALPAEYSYTAFIADGTIEAIHRLHDRPFSISAGILHPHHPMYVPGRWAGTVDAEAMPVLSGRWTRQR